jgi:hypothetical protein
VRVCIHRRHDHAFGSSRKLRSTEPLGRITTLWDGSMFVTAQMGLDSTSRKCAIRTRDRSDPLHAQNLLAIRRSLFNPNIAKDNHTGGSILSTPDCDFDLVV